MPGEMIKIEIDDRLIRALFRRLIQAGAHPEPALRDIGEYMIEATKRRFAESRAPSGAPWAPNKPSTLARKKGGKPLIGESKRLSSEIHYRITGDGVEIGSSLVYAATQQFGARRGRFGRTRRGAPIPWGDIPARPFLGVSDDDRREIADIVAEHIRAATR